MTKSLTTKQGLVHLPLIIGLTLLAILIPITVNLVGQRQEIRKEAADCSVDTLPAEPPLIHQASLCRGTVCQVPGQTLTVEAGQSITASFTHQNTVWVKVRYRFRLSGPSWTGGRGPEQVGYSTKPVNYNLTFSAPAVPGLYEVLVAGYDQGCNFACSKQFYWTDNNCGDPSIYCPLSGSGCSNTPFKLQVNAATVTPTPTATPTPTSTPTPTPTTTTAPATPTYGPSLPDDPQVNPSCRTTLQGFCAKTLYPPQGPILVDT